MSTIVYVIATVVPLAGPANREARVIADNICGIPSTFRGVQSTSICGLFGMTAASTGHTIESLKRYAVFMTVLMDLESTIRTLRMFAVFVLILLSM